MLNVVHSVCNVTLDNNTGIPDVIGGTSIVSPVVLIHTSNTSMKLAYVVGADAVVEGVDMTTGARSETLGEEAVRGVFSADGSARNARDKVMSVVNSIDVDGFKERIFFKSVFAAL